MAIRAVTEVRTVAQFARGFRVSRSTLERRCKQLATTARSCLELAWCGRVVAARTGPWDPDAELTACCADPRTRRQLIERAGLDGPTRPSFDEFLDKQTIVTTRSLVDEIRAAWRRATAVHVYLGAEMFDAFATAMVQAM